MSTANATDLTLPQVGGRHYFLLRRLHSLTGIIFGGYIVIHLLINATLIQGTRAGGNSPTIYQLQVDKIHSLPFLVLIEWIFIYLPILYHTVYGIWIIFTGQPNTTHYPYTRNYFYLLQRISAFIIAAFILFHVLAMKGALGKSLAFNPADATASAEAHFRASFLLGYFVYPLGILASCYHLANGFWTAAITWGLTVSAAAQRRWGYVCAGLFCLTLICGMVALVAVMSAGGPLAAGSHP